MIPRLLKILHPLWIVLSVSCNNNDNNNDKSRLHVNHLTPFRKQTAYRPIDTLWIKENTAVFYRPDSMEWDRLKTLIDPGILESLQHDCFYQQRNARLVIEKFSPPVRIVEVMNKPLLCFIKNNNRKENIDLFKAQDPCGIYLFNGFDSPRLADMTNIDTDLWHYFKHK